ncbi:MAG TPA: hypothetical protein VNZ64_12805 [Candidatus Acidoferrum sp.]|jgi:hypothetical protein|nr:hypothetical protein [Candidatus Acidoferrum sp.]
MTDEEQQIVNFLQSSPESFFGRREIARRAVRRHVFEDNPNWADAHLATLLVKHVIEQDDNGLYRMKKDDLGP